MAKLIVTVLGVCTLALGDALDGERGGPPTTTPTVPLSTSYVPLRWSQSSTQICGHRR